MDTVHKTVLLNETIDNLDVAEGDIVVDATLNAGGHSKEVIRRMKGNVTIIGIDADSDALLRAQAVLEPLKGKVVYIESNFRNLKSKVLGTGIKEVNRFIFDLGLSSDQLENSGRGFSFKRDEPLLMTFSKNPSDDELTARDVVNDFSQDNLETIFKGFGEEPFSGRIARNIVEAREIKPIETSMELAEIVTRAVPARFRKGKTHPATRTFQAIRMAVNAELETLENALKDAFEILAPGGRIAVITFHSLEDRVVKRLFKYLKDNEDAELILKKPIVSSREELTGNPRARSAKLRVIEKANKK